MADRFAIVTTPVDFGYEGITLIEVSLFYGAQHCDVLLSADSRKSDVVFPADEKAGRDIRYSYRAYMRSGPFAQGVQTSFESKTMTTDGTVIAVDPRELYRLLPIRANAVFSKEKFAAAFVDVKLEVDGDGIVKTRTIELTPQSPFDGELVSVPVSAKFALQHRVRYVLREGTVIDGAWQPTEPGAIVVGDPQVVGA